MVSHHRSRAFGPKNMGILFLQSLLVFVVSGVSNWYDSFIQKPSIHEKKCYQELIPQLVLTQDRYDKGREECERGIGDIVRKRENGRENGDAHEIMLFFFLHL